MNKYTKNVIWLNLEKIITFVIVLGMLILTITCATSCSTDKQLANKYNQKVECYDFTN